MFNPYPQLPQFLQQLAKAANLTASSRRFTHSKSDCFFLVFYLRLCIVFKFRCRRLRCSLATTLIIIAGSDPFVNTFLE